MRTRFLASLIVAMGIQISVASSWADSSFTYSALGVPGGPDNSRSQALNIGTGQYAFIFFDLAGDNDIFVHPINALANPLLVVVNSNSAFTGFALWLDFEGFNSGFLQYGVYTCTGGPPCSFGFRRGTIFL